MLLRHRWKLGFDPLRSNCRGLDPIDGTAAC